MEKCKAEIRHGTTKHVFSYRCERKAWKDGYCKQHHPDEIKKAKAKREARWEDKRATGPYAEMRKEEAISKLQILVASLEEENRKFRLALKSKMKAKAKG